MGISHLAGSGLRQGAKLWGLGARRSGRPISWDMWDMRPPFFLVKYIHLVNYMEHLELQNCEYSSLRFFFNDFRMGRRFWAFFWDTDTSNAVARSVQPGARCTEWSVKGRAILIRSGRRCVFFVPSDCRMAQCTIFFKGLQKLKVDVHFFMTRIVWPA